MDCVRTAVRQNAKSVKCLYRRDRKNMPGSTREVYNAEEEGVEFIWLTNPKKFIGTEKISSVLVEKVKLQGIDSSGRKKPEPVPNSNFEVKSDMVIKALGFDPEDIPKLFNSENLGISRWGTIKIDLKTMQTNLPGVFAAGDIVRGASLVVWAVRDGRDAAVQIEKYLNNIQLRGEPYGTDAAWISVKAPALVLGPGDITYAHAIDERIALADVVTGAKIYRDIMLTRFTD